MITLERAANQDIPRVADYVGVDADKDDLLASGQLKNGDKFFSMNGNQEYRYVEEENEFYPVSNGGGGGNVPSPYTDTPQMDGVASAGASLNYSRGDHRHPSDTTKQDKIVYQSATLAAANWVNNEQTVTVQGVLADETAQLIQPVPSASDITAYISNGIVAIAQGANSITFKCDTVPSSDIDIYVVITTLGV